MTVRQASRRELTSALQARYCKASRQGRGRILDTFCEATGYNRRYAMWVLRHGPVTTRPRLTRAGRLPTYTREVISALEIAAEATGWICGKRLAPGLPDLVPALEREGALRLTEAERSALLRISPATIDRRLVASKRRAKPRGLSTTKPGSLLKKQIPVKTYTPWSDQSPGFEEVDLVAHCGDSASGEHLFTLDLVDVATGWTECAGVPNKGQRAVVAAVDEAAHRFPFPVRGLDSDNGSEFINYHLIAYCQEREITMTRSRAYHKDDQAHVEQKNWSVVRQLIGYDRYEGNDACKQLNRVYELVRIWVNGYLPVMKLIGKDREGARVRKRYDVSTTPYRRALAAGVVTADAQVSFEALLEQNGPLGLRRQIDRELERLWQLRAVAQRIPSEIIA